MTYFVKSLGIDLGSIKISINGYVDGIPTPIHFFNGSIDKFETLVSYNKKQGETYFCSDAKVKYAESIDDFELHRNLKECFYLDHEQYTFLLKLFYYIRQKAENQNGIKYDFSRLEKVVFGHPTHMTPSNQSRYCTAITEIIHKVFGAQPEVTSAPEPILSAASYVYANENIFKNKDVLLVLDFGGYTMDMSVVQISKGPKDSIELKELAQSESINGSNDVRIGKYITDTLTQRIYRSLDCFDEGIEEAKCNFFNTGLPQNGTVKFRAHAQRYNAPQNYCIKDKVDPNVDNDPNITYVSMIDHVRVDRIFEHCCKCIDNYLRHYALSQNSINHVLFTGGTARISELRNTIMKFLTSNDYIHNMGTLLWADDPQNNKTKILGNARDLRGFIPFSESILLSSNNAVSFGALLVSADKVNIGRFRTVRTNNATLEKENQKLEKECQHLRNFLTRVRRDLMRWEHEVNLEKIKEEIKNIIPLLPK